METADSAKEESKFWIGLPSGPGAGNIEAPTAQPTDYPES